MKNLIKQSVSMKGAVERYIGEINRAGFIHCPFHKEDTASMKIYEDSYYCFGCGDNGDVIRFVMRLFDIDFRSACVRLNFDFGLNLSGNRADPEQLEKLARKKRKEKQEQKRCRERLNNLSIRHRKLWHIINNKNPQHMGDQPSSEWAGAVHEIEFIGHQIEQQLLQLKMG